MKQLIINPGSTSTKISLYEGERELFTRSIFHDAPLLLSFKSTNDQLPMRRGVIEELLKEYGYKLSDIGKMNYDKLHSRQLRGKLHGNGDNR